MRQKYGQNFLIDKNIAANIIESADISKEDLVIEVGPGKGILTELIAEKAGRLIAVELDPALARKLSEKFKKVPDVEIINSDFMDFSLPEDQPFKIIANLPYYIATAIIQKFLPDRNWKSAVIMIQKEVGERISAGPGSRKYGAFSVFCNYFAKTEILHKVGPKSFFPRPKVDSVVLGLTNIFPSEPDKRLFRVVNLSFGQRRKTILNSLSHGLGIKKEELSAIFQKVNIDPSLRPECLALRSFIDLTSALIYYRIL